MSQNMNENLEKAKKIFFDYACSPYFMARDGVDGEYKSYGPTKELETEWRAEYISNLVARLSFDDFSALYTLSATWAIEALPDLIRMCDQADGFAKLEYADAIWGLSKSSQLDATVRQNAMETAIHAWETLVLGNFKVPEHLLKKVSAKVGFNKATTPEAYVINEAAKQLQEAKKTSN
jgi:hypothetical protein